MAVVSLSVSIMTLTMLRSMDSQLLRGQVRWPLTKFPQATSVYRSSLDFTKIATGTQGDQTDIQINDLDAVPDQAFLLVDATLILKSQAAATKPGTRAVYSAAPVELGLYVPTYLDERDLGDNDWVDPELASTATWPVWFEPNRLIAERSHLISGDRLNGYLPRFSWQNSQTWTSGDEFSYSINLVLVGFPSSMLGSGSHLVPELEYRV